MELGELLKSRAHRMLKRLESYHDLADQSRPHVISQKDIPLEEGEELIGFYASGMESHRELIILTTKAIHLTMSGEQYVVKYQDIEHLDASSIGEKDTATGIIVQTARGQLALPVKGGHGRFRDVWTFLHFLTRVVDDVRRAENNKA